MTRAGCAPLTKTNRHAPAMRAASAAVTEAGSTSLNSAALAGEGWATPTRWTNTALDPCRVGRGVPRVADHRLDDRGEL